MRKIFLAFLACCGLATAEVKVTDLDVKGKTVTVKLQNTAPFAVQVDEVKLRIRRAGGWVGLKHWISPLNLEAGEVRELKLTAPGLGGNYELLAEVASSATVPAWESADR